MKMKKSNIEHIFFAFVSFTFFCIIFYVKQPFWGLMDDATSIKLALEFSSDPFVTTKKWLSQNNVNGMFRPFFALQQFIQYYFYEFDNPYPTFFLNIFIVMTSIYLFSNIFVKVKDLYIFYSVIFLWPYTYDWLLMPTLNEKWGLIFLCLGLSLKNKYLKFLFGVISVLFKLNLIILFPLAWYLEKSKTNNFYFSFGMLLGLSVQTFFFFYYPDSYYNTGIFQTILDINFFTLQNCILLIILLLAIFDLFVSTKGKRLHIYSIITSLLIAFVILNLRNSSFAYLGAILVFPISQYLILFINKFSFYKTDVFKKIILTVCIVVSTLLFLFPRIDRWNDIKAVLNQQLTGDAIYFCYEGQRMINIWDIENKNLDNSFFKDSSENFAGEDQLWVEENKSDFRFQGEKENTFIEEEIIYIVDPYCGQSMDFLIEISNCDFRFYYSNEIKLIGDISC